MKKETGIVQARNDLLVYETYKVGAGQGIVLPLLSIT
jgi:hypothetical protein